MRISKIKLKRTKEFFKRLPRILAEKAFLTFLFLFLIALVIGTIIFYQYSFSIKKTEIKILKEPLKFNEKAYQKVLKIWQQKEKKFKEADFKEYLDSFRPKLAPKKLSKERKKELLASPFIQELLKATNLYEFYQAKKEKFLSIEERAQIWEELGLGKAEEYQGTYFQNIKFLKALKEELTK